jgi:hypothetical protein
MPRAHSRLFKPYSKPKNASVLRFMASELTAQNLLWQAHRRGVTIRPDHQGNLTVSANGSSLVPDVRRLKPQLLTLTVDLERYGVGEESIVLEALSLFNAESKGLVKSPSMPFSGPVSLPIALGETQNTTPTPHGRTNGILEMK